MAERLLSVGLDVGTTSTQLIVSELLIENKASAFTVPEMTIAERKILYKSPVHFTPLLDEQRVDGQGIRQIVTAEYENAGITRSSVDTGAIIITGETSRKENARAVLEALSDFAGEFVVATAGPDLESILAARGAQAVEYSAKTGKTVLHMDIGGGTSNLALIEDGTIIRTGCLNVGGRLVKFDEQGVVTYLSPVLSGLTDLKAGSPATAQQIENLAQTLAKALEMAAGLRPPTELLDRLWTAETAHRAAHWPSHDSNMVISFSGGVADCIEADHPPLAFGDMGPALGRAIRASRLCQGPYVLGQETIRATVIGAGCHSAQLSGSTVFHRNVVFPLKNLPVVTISAAEQEQSDLPDLIRSRFAVQDTAAVLAMPGFSAAGYGQIAALADAIAANLPSGPVYLALEQDMAKALGQALALRLRPERSLLCLDRIRLEEGSFLDVAAPIGPALPVVIKTLVLSHHLSHQLIRN
jgi:ethanolamine utilization protein EutA